MVASIAEDVVVERSDAVVVDLEPLEVGQPAERHGGEGQHLVVAQIEILERAQALEGIIFNLELKRKF